MQVTGILTKKIIFRPLISTVVLGISNYDFLNLRKSQNFIVSTAQ
jgi:hypothetical protein